MATNPASESGGDDEWDYVADREEPELNSAAILPGLCAGARLPEGEIPDDDGDPRHEWSPTWVLDWVAGNPAGPTAMTLLAGLAPRSLSSFDRVRLLEAWDRQVAHCEAMKLTAMKAVVDDDAGSGFVAHEIGAALHISRPAADRLVTLCRRLARTLPGTARALADGRISRAHAVVLSEETGPLSAELAGQVEATLLPDAGLRTAGQLRYAAGKLIARLDPDGFTDRHRRRRPDNDVTVSDLGDGLSGIWAALDTPDAAVIKTAVDAWADRHTTVLPDLTVGQRRTQALVAWASDYLTGPDAPSRHGRPVTVDLVIDLPTLLGLADHPGEIVGYGVIPADLARRLAADGSWRRLVTDPQTGHLIDCGRTRYRPSQALRDYLLARERVSAFPGATTPSDRCDIDHADPYPHGTTDRDNLRPLDRRAHRAKTQGGWTAQRTANGSCRLRSPAGHTYRTEPHDYRLGP